MIRLFITTLMVVWVFCALAVEKSATIVYINGSKFYIHTVQSGETIYSIARAYQVGEQVILKNNPTVATGLQLAASIKIPFVAEFTESISEKKLLKTFEIRYIAKGETLYSISRKYDIPVQTIIADNPNLDPAYLKTGARLLLRKKQIGTADEQTVKAQWEEYRQSLNSVAEPGFSYHIVKPGETFYSLARRFELSEEQLSALNSGLKPSDLKAGSILKVPAPIEPTAETTTEQTEVAPVAVTPTIAFHALRAGQELNVALMLPIAVGSAANNNYLEFYQGFLLGLDSVRINYGCSINVSLYNTERDVEKIVQIVQSDDFRKTHLIIGPVYEEGLLPVVRFAETNSIPVVSPLANVTTIKSDVLFQMAPAPEFKYAKIAELVANKKVTLIYSAATDKEFEAEILAMLGDKPHVKHTYRYIHPTSGRSAAGGESDLSPLLDNSDDNLFVVLSDNETDTDRILAAIASANINLTARSRATPRFAVLGNARWNRYNNIDREVLFMDRVIFLSTYHAKRNTEAVTNFDNAYIRTFGTLPTLYSYRGYDAATIFAPAMYNDIEYNMQGRTFTPLQTSYTFGQTAVGENRVNRNWTRVNYNPDFTITIE